MRRERNDTAKKNIIIVLLCFAAVFSYGAEPPTQMATLRWTGDGDFLGWRWEKMEEPFEDGAARLAADSRIVSPTWPKLDIVGAAVTLSCSTNAPDRWLQATFLRDGKAVSGPIRLDAVCAAKCRATTDFTRFTYLLLHDRDYTPAL